MTSWRQDARRLATFWGIITVVASCCFLAAYWYGVRAGHRIAQGAVPVNKITERRSAASQFAYTTVDRGLRVRVPGGEGVPVEPQVLIVSEAASDGVAADEDTLGMGPWSSQPLTTSQETEEEAAPGESAPASSRPDWMGESAEARRFTVDAGRFRDEQDMRRAAQQLRDRGYPVFIEEESGTGRARYHLRVGAFERSSDALKMKDELNQQGLLPATGPSTPEPTRPEGRTGLTAPVAPVPAPASPAVGESRPSAGPPPSPPPTAPPAAPPPAAPPAGERPIGDL